jgi:hypothetical protein
MPGYRKFADRIGEKQDCAGTPAKAAKALKFGGRNLSAFAALAGVEAQARNFADDPAWWRDLLDERAAIRQFDGGYGHAEAERLAWEEIECLRHRLFGERVSRDLCAGCLQPIAPAQALALDHGCRVHLACVSRYGRRWREAAATALAALGLYPPRT